MSRGPGCGIALTRLIAIPVALGAAGALLPMSFGRPFAWHIGFIVFVLTFAVVFGLRLLRAEQGPEPLSGERTEHHVGEFAIGSGALILGDGSDLRGQVRIDQLPTKIWRATCYTSGEQGAALLDEVVLEAAGGTESSPRQDQVIVIDSGDLVVVDSEAAARPFKGGTLRDEVERLRAARPSQPGGVGLLQDGAGTALGLVFSPPFGDGEYSVQFVRRGAVLEVRIRVGGDA